MSRVRAQVVSETIAAMAFEVRAAAAIPCACLPARLPARFAGHVVVGGEPHHAPLRLHSPRTSSSSSSSQPPRAQVATEAYADTKARIAEEEADVHLTADLGGQKALDKSKIAANRCAAIALRRHSSQQSERHGAATARLPTMQMQTHGTATADDFATQCA